MTPELETPLLDSSGNEDEVLQGPDALEDEQCEWTLSTLTPPPTMGHHRSLSTPLWWMFFLNGGFVSAMPTSAMMYILNSRVQVPVAFLSTYGALTFLPFSLKPLYAWATPPRHVLSRPRQLFLLLAFHAVVTVAIGFVPRKGVVQLTVLAFGQSVANSWAEFLLGLSLIAQAQQSAQGGGDVDNDDPLETFRGRAARFQAQAATARNVGSVASYLVGLLVFGVLPKLNDTTARLLMSITAVSSLFSGVVAQYLDAGPSPEPVPRPPQRAVETVVSTDEEAKLPEMSSSSPLLQVTRQRNREGASKDDTTWWTSQTCLVVVLQLTVALMAFRGPMMEVLQPQAVNWGILLPMGFLFLILVVHLLRGRTQSGEVAVEPRSPWQSSSSSYLRVGLFLVLRHVLPTSGFLVGSYKYSLLGPNHSFLLQLLSVWDTVHSALASFAYGRLWAPYTANSTHFRYLIVGLTMLGALASLLQLPLINLIREYAAADDNGACGWNVGLLGPIILIYAVLQWTSEWAFLPDVVLATVSLETPPSCKLREGQEDGIAVDPTLMVESTALSNDPSVTQDSTDDSTANRLSEVDAMRLQHNESWERQQVLQYGSLISCIDFGDQWGALSTGILVSALGLSRSNNWANLDLLVDACAALLFVSAALVLLLPQRMMRRIEPATSTPIVPSAGS